MPDLSWDLLTGHLVRLGLAYVLALPVAWDRERHERTAGLRTFPIVALASCGFMLLAVERYGEDPRAEARILQGLMTGIGFIGGGAILKKDSRVKGTATAASIWATGGIGTAVAYSHYEIAVPLSLGVFLTLRALTPFKEETGTEDDRADDDLGGDDEAGGESEKSLV